MFNFSDDFYEDGYVPEGEIQRTFIRIESPINLCLRENYECLLSVLSHLSTECNLSEKINISLEFYDSKDKYPNLEEYMRIKEWKLILEHITHEDMDELLVKLKENNLTYNGKKFRFYSES